MRLAQAIRSGLFVLASSALSAGTLTQCPPGNIAGTAYTGCNFSFVANADGTFTTRTDPTQPYIGGEDSYAAFQNNTAGTIYSILVDGHGLGLFAFDQDGPHSGNFQPACSGMAAQSGAGTGSLTGYEGPGTGFSKISADCTKGTVNFADGVAPGHSAYFFLEEALDPNFPTPTLGAVLTVAPGIVPEPSPGILLGAGLLLVFLRRLR